MRRTPFLTCAAAVAHVKAFVAEVRRIGVPVRQAILFGSYARNEQPEWSNLDVALISDSFTGAGPLDVRAFGHLMWDYHRVEPHTFPTTDFEDGDAFAEEIKRTGIVVA